MRKFRGQIAVLTMFVALLGLVWLFVAPDEVRGSHSQPSLQGQESSDLYLSLVLRAPAPPTATETATPESTSTATSEPTNTVTPEPTETATPDTTETPSPTATSESTPSAPPRENWLAYLNYYRALAELPAVTENGAWSQGDREHACYMVQNNVVAHDQSAGGPCASAAGAEAAQTSNVMVSSNVNAPDAAALDYWMQAPFHSVAILDPALREVGFGSHREADGGFQMAAALDVGRGIGSVADDVTFPIMWPGEGATVPLVANARSEWPSPLASCPGYTAPAGLPIVLQLGAGEVTPQVTEHDLTENGEAVDHCLFDETSYSSANSGEQYVGRTILGSRDAVVLLPRAPLNPGANYTVSITANGQSHTWSFSVSEDARLLEEGGTPPQ